MSIRRTSLRTGNSSAHIQSNNVRRKNESTHTVAIPPLNGPVSASISVADAVALTKSLGMWNRSITPQRDLPNKQSPLHHSQRNTATAALHQSRKRRRRVDEDSNEEEMASAKHAPYQLKYSLPSTSFHLHSILGSVTVLFTLTSTRNRGHSMHIR
jgi:hypothetical protein